MHAHLRGVSCRATSRDHACHARTYAHASARAKLQGNWLRKHARTLLRRFLNITSYDLSIEAKLLDSLDGVCTGDHIASFFAGVREACWGKEGGALTKFPPLSEAEREQRRSACQAALKGLFLKAPLPMLLGKAGCERASLRLFSLIQNDILNRHLALTLTDELVHILFPEVDLGPGDGGDGGALHPAGYEAVAAAGGSDRGRAGKSSDGRVGEREGREGRSAGREPALEAAGRPVPPPGGEQAYQRLDAQEQPESPDGQVSAAQGAQDAGAGAETLLEGRGHGRRRRVAREAAAGLTTSSAGAALAHSGPGMLGAGAKGAREGAVLEASQSRERELSANTRELALEAALEAAMMQIEALTARLQSGAVSGAS